MRESAEKIFARRRSRQSVFLVTGATGFLGSHIASGLLTRGFRVVLPVRGGAGLSPRGRFERVGRWLGLGQAELSRAEVIEASLEHQDLALDSEALARIQGEIDEVVHCAAETSFAERRRAQVERVNVEGTREVLQLSAGGKVSFFHHLSTVYVAGCTSGHFGEQMSDSTSFNNVYEESKQKAERLALELCSRNGIRLNIYRPSIVYGDSRTGRSLTFKALYYPVKTLLFLRKTFLEDMRGGDGARAREMGIHREPGGFIRMPIRMQDGDSRAGINLTPVDHFTRAFFAIFEHALQGGIYHIINPRPVSLASLTEFTSRQLRIRGLRCVTVEDLPDAPRNAIETLFDSYLRVYSPYIRDGRTFLDENAREMLDSAGIPPCPELDYASFRRCMEFACSVEWGKRLFEQD